jgi:hypothetical protein
VIGRAGLAAYIAAITGIAWFDGGASLAFRFGVALVFMLPIAALAFKETQK